MKTVIIKSIKLLALFLFISCSSVKIDKQNVINQYFYEDETNKVIESILDYYKLNNNKVLLYSFVKNDNVVESKENNCSDNNFYIYFDWKIYNKNCVLVFWKNYNNDLAFELSQKEIFQMKKETFKNKIYKITKLTNNNVILNSEENISKSFIEKNKIKESDKLILIKISNLVLNSKKNCALFKIEYFINEFNSSNSINKDVIIMRKNKNNIWEFYGHLIKFPNYTL